MSQIPKHLHAFEVILTVHRRYYVEIKCQLDVTDDIYCRFYCMLTSLRPAHPLRPRGFPGKDRKPPHLNRQAPQPPHGTTATLSDHQASKTTLDLRRATLRKRRWTLS